VDVQIIFFGADDILLRMRQIMLSNPRLKRSLPLFFCTRRFFFNTERVEEKHVLHILQHEQKLQGPQVYTEKRQYSTHTQLPAMVTKTGISLLC
jgi:hypothetical protein